MPSVLNIKHVIIIKHSHVESYCRHLASRLLRRQRYLALIRVLGLRGAAEKSKTVQIQQEYKSRSLQQ